MALWRFHGQRVFSANYFSKNLVGGLALIYLADYFACKQFGISRIREPNLLWPWWLEFQAKLRAGTIPQNTPGYAVAEFRNAHEERALETLDVEAINREREERVKAYYAHHGGGHHDDVGHSKHH